MASSSSTAATDAADVPPLPDKLRPKPQQRGNIGAGKLYADQAAFDADMKAYSSFF